MLRLLFSIVYFSFISHAFSQTSNQPLKVFLDCNFCDNSYIKQNLNNVEFVRDQNFAEVHLFFVRQTNGSGGRLYAIDFIGKKELDGLIDKISFSTDTDMTDDDVRNRILNFIKLGMVRYWLKKEHTDVVAVTVGEREVSEGNEEVDDPWDFWVIQLNVRGNINGEQSRRELDANFSASASRVTEKNKFFIRAGFSENTSIFKYADEDIVSSRQSKDIRIEDVISVNGNWSIGAFGRVGTSVYNNQEFYWKLKPAIEFIFFNYVDSAEKQLALSYSNGVVFNDYIALTVYEKDMEYLWEHELKLGGSVKQRWGNINAQTSFAQYLHDTTLNAFRFNLGVDIRLFKGFNFNINGDYRVVGNQINLPAGDVTLEGLLLQQQQLASGYNYSLRVGINYSFGSIYNSVVNPRFNF